MRALSLLTLVVALGAVFAGPSAAQSTNAGAAIAIGSPSYRIPVGIAVQPDSGALVLTVDFRSGSPDIFAQRVDRHGRPTLAAGGVYVTAWDPNEAIFPIADGAGGLLVLKAETRGATGKDIVAYRVLANGTMPYGPSGLVVCNATRDQSRPFLIAGPSGFFYVAWQDDRANLGGQFDIYAQKVSLAGAVQWAVNGIPVNTAAYRPWSYGINEVAADGQGGLILTWTYNSYGGPMRAQRVSSAGALQWTATGVAFGDASYGASGIAPDGLGGVWGMYTAWDGTYNRPYAYHLLSTGAAAFAGGVQFSPSQYGGTISTSMIRDGTGGCFAFVQPWYSGSTSTTATIYRQQLSSTGTLLRGSGGEMFGASPESPRMFDAGSSIIYAVTEQAYPTARTMLRVQRLNLDGTAIFPGTGTIVNRPEGTLGVAYPFASLSATGVTAVSWGDGRYNTQYSGLSYQGFGQALSATGAPLWDDAERPTIVSAKDAAADQGGRVRVTWNASIADHPAARAAKGYRVWRALPDAAVASFSSARPSGDGIFHAGGRTLLALANSYWEMAGEQAASTLPSYALTVATLQDSMAGSPADQSFMVEAWDDSSHHWFSDARVAHSVDNLPPSAITSATGQYAGGSTSLAWSAVADADLCCYEVFRGTTPGFVPNDANRVHSTTDQLWTDASGPSAYYRIAAVDVHGNRGPSALVAPTGTAAVGDDAPTRWALRAASAAGAVELTLDAPQADDGRVELFDVTGRRLWESAWRTDAARALRFRAQPGDGLRAGVVYARVTSSATGRQLVTRTVVLR